MSERIREVLLHWLETFTELFSVINTQTNNEAAAAHGHDILRPHVNNRKSYRRGNLKSDRESTRAPHEIIKLPTPAYRPIWLRRRDSKCTDEDLDFECCGPGDRRSLFGAVSVHIPSESEEVGKGNPDLIYMAFYDIEQSDLQA
ncbi:hypothetical protein TWF718_009691 [Orbilia javanica]|uniref:Uncharacterized protein n=1 Tax=Orbilia javanica TaxID=47235 RepID=A0AAN8MQ71_9PEZI